MEKLQKILIALDNGPTAEKVALHGLQLAKQLHADIALVSIVDTFGLITDGGVTPRELADSVINDYKKSHQLLLDTVFKGCNVWSFVDEGKPFEAIIKVAEEWEADLIVMGTHGRTGLSHLLMGSVAEKIIRHTVKPIFIVPTK
jgi:nucleotide-binding universal stress UspA family protein